VIILHQFALFKNEYFCIYNYLVFIAICFKTHFASFFLLILRFFFFFLFLGFCRCGVERKRSDAEENRKEAANNKQTEEKEEGRKEGGPPPGAQVSAATRRTCASSDEADVCHHVVAATQRRGGRASAVRGGKKDATVIVKREIARYEWLFVRAPIITKRRGITRTGDGGASELISGTRAGSGFGGGAFRRV
jgi:hypothetical protein